MQKYKLDFMDIRKCEFESRFTANDEKAIGNSMNTHTWKSEIYENETYTRNCASDFVSYHLQNYST